MNSECDRDPLPIATSCREQSSLLQKTRNEGIAMGILTPSLSTQLIPRGRQIVRQPGFRVKRVIAKTGNK